MGGHVGTLLGAHPLRAPRSGRTRAGRSTDRAVDPITPSSARHGDVGPRRSSRRGTRTHHERDGDQRGEPAASRAADAHHHLEDHAHGVDPAGGGSQRSRCASSACRQSRATPITPRKMEPGSQLPWPGSLDQQDAAEREGGEHDRGTDVAESTDPAQAGVRPASRSPDRGRRCRIARPPEAPATDRGRTPLPSPPSRAARTKPTRTHSTGTARWRAPRPDATPPMIGSCVSRVARRTSGGPAVRA